MAIIGAILGDIAGSKWEFNRPKDLDYEHIELFQDDSYYTDDTVLSVATKYALENEVSFKDAYNEFGNDYIDCGYGGAKFGAGIGQVFDENGKAIPFHDPRTAKARSKTFSGVAKAMADTWG